MLVGGLYLFASEILLADIIYFRFVIGGAVVAVLGAYLLWTDEPIPNSPMMMRESYTCSGRRWLSRGVSRSRYAQAPARYAA
jgi:hypothetical protein